MKLSLLFIRLRYGVDTHGTENGRSGATFCGYHIEASC